MFCVLIFVFVFFFKQKTAYEMRISDWSSDVCSSDLVKDNFAVPVYAYQVSGEYAMIEAAAAVGAGDRDALVLETLLAFRRAGASGEIGRASCRERVCQYV